MFITSLYGLKVSSKTFNCCFTILLVVIVCDATRTNAELSQKELVDTYTLVPYLIISGQNSPCANKYKWDNILVNSVVALCGGVIRHAPHTLSKLNCIQNSADIPCWQLELIKIFFGGGIGQHWGRVRVILFFTYNLSTNIFLGVNILKICQKLICLYLKE